MLSHSDTVHLREAPDDVQSLHSIACPVGGLRHPEKPHPVLARPAAKLDVLRVECAKCGRSGQYRVAALIAKYGRDAKLFDWSDELTADCPRKRAANKTAFRQWLSAIS